MKRCRRCRRNKPEVEKPCSEERDSFKGWEQECSSAPQGHRYFMAFAFLHDTSDAQNSRSSIASREGLGGGGANVRVLVLSWSPLTQGFNQQRCRRLCGEGSGTQCCRVQPSAGAGLIYRGPRSSCRQQRKPPQPLSSPPDCSLIPLCFSCQHHKLVFNNVTTFNQH